MPLMISGMMFMNPNYGWWFIASGFSFVGKSFLITLTLQWFGGSDWRSVPRVFIFPRRWLVTPFFGVLIVGPCRLIIQGYRGFPATVSTLEGETKCLLNWWTPRKGHVSRHRGMMKLEILIAESEPDWLRSTSRNAAESNGFMCWLWGLPFGKLTQL